MATAAAVLREIHRLKRFIKDLKTEIERIPRQLKAQQTRLAKVEQDAKDGHDLLKKLKVKVHEKETELKQTQQQMIKHQDQMNGASSKKEYDAFKTEIAHDRAQCDQLEEEIIKTMLEVDEKTVQVPELDKTVKAAKEEHAVFEKESQTREVELKQQLERALQQLKEVEASLPEKIREQYLRLTGQREDAMSSVAGRTCTACYTEITAQNSNELLQGMFVVCKSCGRILYLPEQAVAVSEPEA